MGFESIIGNDKIKNILKKTVKDKNILHSYLFYGNEGIGKKIFATEFAKMILCNNDSENACNSCKSCIEFDTGNNPDFYIIEPDGNSIKIDQIRQMQKTILEKPIESNKKIYIINDANLMTKESQNCLLKTLEEPQEYAVIILIASDEEKMLTTVKSRCTKIFFEKINDEDLQKFINQKFNDVQFNSNILKLCNGSISKTLKVLDKKEILSELEDFMNNFENLDELKVLNFNTFFSDNKEDINLLLDYICILLFNKIKTVIKNEENYIESIKIVQHTKNKLLYSNNFDMTIDNMLIRMWREIDEKNSRS